MTEMKKTKTPGSLVPGRGTTRRSKVNADICRKEKSGQKRSGAITHTPDKTAKWEGQGNSVTSIAPSVGILSRRVPVSWGGRGTSRRREKCDEHGNQPGDNSYSYNLRKEKVSHKSIK